MKKDSRAGTSKEFRAVALKNYFYYLKVNGSCPVTREGRGKCIYFYTELLNYLQNTYVWKSFLLMQSTLISQNVYVSYDWRSLIYAFAQV